MDISEGIDLSIFLFGSFQQNLVLSINRHIFSQKKSRNNYFNIIDIGSNIGDKSLSITSGLLSKNFTNFKVFSIEPTDYAFKKQINNINLNTKLKKRLKHLDILYLIIKLNLKIFILAGVLIQIKILTKFIKEF